MRGGGAQVEDGWGTAWLTLGCVGIAMTAASTLFVHRIYTGKLGDSRAGSSRAELSSLVGGDKDSDVSDDDNAPAPAAKGSK